MENSVVEVLVQPATNEISLIAVDDTTGESVETTLSPERAWALVTEINTAIQRLAAKPIVEQPKKQVESKPAQVKEALLEALDHKPRGKHHIPPGPPATKAKSKPFRVYKEPVSRAT